MTEPITAEHHAQAVQVAAERASNEGLEQAAQTLNKKSAELQELQVTSKDYNGRIQELVYARITLDAQAKVIRSLQTAPVVDAAAEARYEQFKADVMATCEKCSGIHNVNRIAEIDEDGFFHERVTMHNEIPYIYCDATNIRFANPLLSARLNAEMEAK